MKKGDRVIGNDSGDVGTVIGKMMGTAVPIFAARKRPNEFQ